MIDLQDSVVYDRRLLNDSLHQRVEWSVDRDGPGDCFLPAPVEAGGVDDGLVAARDPLDGGREPVTVEGVGRALALSAAERLEHLVGQVEPVHR